MRNQYCIYCDSIHDEKSEMLTNGIYRCIHLDTFLRDYKEEFDINNDLIIINDPDSAIKMADSAKILPFYLKEAILHTLEVASRYALRKDWPDAWLRAEEAKLLIYNSL